MTDRPSRATAWLSGLLLISVAFNCLLIGVVAGRLLWPRDEATAVTGGDGSLTFGERVRRLPPTERDKFQAAMQPHRPAIRAAREELATARAQFREALRHEPYDAAALLQAMAAMRAKNALLQQRIQEASAQAFAVLSPQSREQLSRPYPRR